MNLIINGENVKLDSSSNVAEMLIERGVSGTMFVVEKNKEIVQKEDYLKTSIAENDVLEIVSFFGGG